MWLSSLLLEKHDLIRKVKLHSEHSLFSPLSFLIHDPRSNFQTPSSLSCMKTQTSRWRYLLLRPHLCKHFLTHQLHVPKHYFSNTHTRISHTRPDSYVINCNSKVQEQHHCKKNSTSLTQLPYIGFKYFSPAS